LLVRLPINRKEFLLSWNDRKLMKFMLEHSNGVAIKSVAAFSSDAIWYALKHGWADCIEGKLKPNRLTVELAKQFDDYVEEQRRHYRDVRKVVTSKTRILKIINEGDVQVERHPDLKSIVTIRFELDPHSIVFLYQESEGLSGSHYDFSRIFGTPYYGRESGLLFVYEDKLSEKARTHEVKSKWEREIESAVLNRKEVKEALTMNLI